ncbi:UTP--glucose-1-phosphate uridylyltransferase AglF [uncultured archaeon]|nr:UTP--glucose-1-phosphate uridylyltransferase AglF [uncultured archaeon]
MKGIILAGGQGVRLNPLTEITNKHLLPVGKEPMIWHPIKQLVGSNITEIMVITSTHHMGDIVNSLGSGKRFGCNFTYKVQEEASGIAHALSLCEQFAKGDKIVVLLGDNIFEYSIKPHVQAFLEQDSGARVLLKEVDDPRRFGVAALDEKHVIEIEEKPAQPKSNHVVVGCYMYGNQVFDLIRKIEPSLRGELEITSVNNLYIQQRQLQYSFVKGRWADAGTFSSLNEANQLMLENDNRILI